MEFFVLSVFLIIVCVYISGNRRKRNLFNSIEPGDKIYYSPGTNGVTLFKNKKETIVIGVERGDDHDIEYIYTEDGGKYSFMDYKRERFSISLFSVFD